MGKRLLLIITIFIITMNFSYSQGPQYELILKNPSQYRMQSYHEKIVIISAPGSISTQKGKNRKPVELFDGKNWSRIPFTYTDDNGNPDTIFYHRNTYPEIEFDTKVNIWTPANRGFFKYQDGNWHRYFIDDEYKNARDFKRMCFDSNGNIWLASNYYIKDAIISELYKFDGQDFELMVRFDEGYSEHFSSDYGLMTSSDGRVWAHRYDQVDKDMDLYIFSEDGTHEILTMPTPHSILKPGSFKGNKAVVSVTEDKDQNMWFLLQSMYNSNDDDGLIVLRNDGSWFALSENNNYPIRDISGVSNSIPWDTLYNMASYVYCDSKNRIWIGGTGLLNLIDENDDLIHPDPFDLNNIILYLYENPSNGADIEELESYISDSLLIMLNNFSNQDPPPKFGNYRPWVESISETRDGSMWFALGMFGIIRYLDPETLVKENNPILTTCSIFPQPIQLSKLRFIITFDEPIKQANLLIYNEKGQKIESIFINPNSISNKTEIKLRNIYSTGVYFAVVHFNNKIIFRKLIII